MGFGVAGRQRNGAAVGDGRFLQLPLVPQRVAEIVVQPGDVRLQFECPAIAGNRFVELALAQQHVAEVVERLRVVRFERDRPPPTFGRFGELALVLED